MLSCQNRRALPVTDPAATPFVLEFRKGPCFGTCPVSVTTIYENRVIGFEGIRYTARTGRFYRSLSAEEWKQVMQLIRRADWWDYPERYDSDIADLPTFSFEVHLNGKARTITGKEGFPEALETLMALLDTLGSGGTWQGGTLR